ncbi:MAG: EamA family transporter [Paludibacteraceae bacterium]|nr:EamA family transporter [Paludibacteraceae bacterium]
MPLSRNNPQYLAVGALIASMIIWSVSGIAIKQALLVLPPFTMIVLRFVPSVLLMLVIGLLCRQHSLFCLQKMQLRDLPLFLIAGFCQPFLYYMLETYTYRALNSPTVAETLLSTSPLIAPVFAAVLLRERITRNNILGIIISTLGVFMLTLLGESSLSPLTNNLSPLSIGHPIGIPLAFAAVSAAVIDSVMMRKVPARYSPLSFVFYTQLISLLFFLPVWFFRESWVLENSEWLTANSQWPIAILCVAYLTVFASVVAFILFCYGLRRVGVTRANAFNNIRPVFTAMWMFLFFGEHLHMGKWLGIVLIIFGLFVCQRKAKT